MGNVVKKVAIDYLKKKRKLAERMYKKTGKEEYLEIIKAIDEIMRLAL